MDQDKFFHVLNLILNIYLLKMIFDKFNYNFEDLIISITVFMNAYIYHSNVRCQKSC